MSDVIGWIAGCTTVVLLLCLLIGGPIGCTIKSQQEATKRVIAVCSGDLRTDSARAAACIMAIRDAKGAGQ